MPARAWSDGDTGWSLTKKVEVRKAKSLWQSPGLSPGRGMSCKSHPWRKALARDRQHRQQAARSREAPGGSREERTRTNLDLIYVPHFDMPMLEAERTSFPADSSGWDLGGPSNAHGHEPEEGSGPCGVPGLSVRLWLCFPSWQVPKGLLGCKETLNPQPKGVKAQMSLLGCTGRQEQPLQRRPEEREAFRGDPPAAVSEAGSILLLTFPTPCPSARGKGLSHAGGHAGGTGHSAGTSVARRDPPVAQRG